MLTWLTRHKKVLVLILPFLFILKKVLSLTGVKVKWKEGPTLRLYHSGEPGSGSVRESLQSRCSNIEQITFCLTPTSFFIYINFKTYLTLHTFRSPTSTFTCKRLHFHRPRLMYFFNTSFTQPICVVCLKTIPILLHTWFKILQFSSLCFINYDRYVSPSFNEPTLTFLENSLSWKWFRTYILSNVHRYFFFHIGKLKCYKYLYTPSFIDRENYSFLQFDVVLVRLCYKNSYNKLHYRFMLFLSLLYSLLILHES